MAARHVNRPGRASGDPGRAPRGARVAVGDDMVIELKQGELRLRSLDAAIERAQEIVRRYVPEGVSLDELIRERRDEAAREEKG